MNRFFTTLRQINDSLYFADNLGNVCSFDGRTLDTLSGTPFSDNNYVTSIAEFNGSTYFGTSTASVYRYDGSAYELVYEVSNRSPILDMATWQKDGYLYVSVGPQGICCPPTGYTIRSLTGDMDSWETVFGSVWHTPILMPTSEYLYTGVLDSAYGYGSSVRKSSNGTDFPVIHQSSGQYKFTFGSLYYDGIAYFFTNGGSGFGYRVIDENGAISLVPNQDWTLTQTVVLNGQVYALVSTSQDVYQPADVYLITTNMLTVVSPDGGEEFVSGKTEAITWKALDSIENVSIEYSTSNGLSWQVIDPNTPNDGEYDWTLPTVTSNQCLVRISDVSNPNVSDTSDDVFTIYECVNPPVSDLNKDCKVNLADFAIFASDWLFDGDPFSPGFTESLPIIWVSIDDPGVSGHEGFTGYMSKYETTNAQYCQFLNAALAAGQITVYTDNIVYAASDTSHSQPYYDSDGGGLFYWGATNGGAARINYSGGLFSVDSSFENHPVTYVSWYGATAFCDYYGYRLPTEWEWQAVADYNGTYTYGCGAVINTSIANYYGSIHLNGTTIVGSFGDPSGYGYGMCDMAGNAFEWTSSIYSGSSRVLRGGCWYDAVNGCSVSRRDVNHYPDDINYSYIGFRVCRDIPDIKWVHINDSGVSGHERFDGYMSKYETTNAQYCQFLNAALASGDIIVDANDIKGTNGSNSGADFIGEVYYNLAGAGWNHDGATNGGAARIHYTGSVFTVDSGFENHPVNYVSWYGATAFCNYYGYRLPTEWEWQAVADYDGSYTYGCGTSINNNIANYFNTNHPDGTTIVGSFGTYGYGMCDMAGNVGEWTSSNYGGVPIYYACRSGGWNDYEDRCAVSFQHSAPLPNSFIGFRVCR